MSRRILLSSSVTKLIATPFLPKRPPRPILHKKKNIYTQVNLAHLFYLSARSILDCCSYLPLASLCCLKRASCHSSHLVRKNQQLVPAAQQVHSVAGSRAHTLLFGCKARSSFNAQCCVLKSWVSLSPLSLTTHPPLMHPPLPSTENTLVFNNQTLTKLIQFHPITWNSTLKFRILIQPNCFQWENLGFVGFL